VPGRAGGAQRRGDIVHGPADERQVGAAARGRRRTHADQRQLGPVQRFRAGRGRAQRAGGYHLADEVVQARLG